MSPSLSKIHVLATLTMPSFALEAREEYTGHVNPWFLQQRRARDRRTARWFPLSVQLRRSQHTSFAFFSLLDEWHWDRDIEWKGLISPNASKNRSSLHSETILNHTIACSHTFFLEALPWRHRPTHPILRILLGRGPKKRLILRSLKIHRKLMKIATTIFFSLYLSERRGDLYNRKKKN